MVMSFPFWGKQAAERQATHGTQGPGVIRQYNENKCQNSNVRYRFPSNPRLLAFWPGPRRHASASHARATKFATRSRRVCDCVVECGRAQRGEVGRLKSFECVFIVLMCFVLIFFELFELFVRFWDTLLTCWV